MLHDGTKSGVLARKIELECRNEARILYISRQVICNFLSLSVQLARKFTQLYFANLSICRQYFDQDRGAEMLKKVLVGDVDGDLIAKYTVLSGAYCLMRYIENCSGCAIAPHSMRFV